MPDLDLTPEQRSELALALHNATRCNCDSGEGHYMAVDEIAPLIASWLALDPRKVELLDATLSYRREAQDLRDRLEALTAKLADVPRWLDLNGMDPQSVAFVRTALDAVTTTPVERS